MALALLHHCPLSPGAGTQLSHHSYGPSRRGVLLLKLKSKAGFAPAPNWESWNVPVGVTIPGGSCHQSSWHFSLAIPSL